MKKVLFILVLLYLLMFFMGCNLFKKTTKNSSSNTQSSARQAEFNQRILKTANKETQIFTYWKDSMIYQYQNIKEHVEEAKSAGLKVKEAELAKQQQTIKETEPASSWVFVGVLVVLLALMMLCMYVSRHSRLS